MHTIDAKMLQKSFLAGANRIEQRKEEINALNVFPVPDGDTGTNMTMTILAAAEEVANVEPLTLSTLAKAIATGSLRGARGNSGVILSQLFRGFSKEIEQETEITVLLMAKAFQRAVELAYKAVMKPKEGTILTVAKAGAERAMQLAKTEKDMLTFCGAVIEAMQQTLQKTPDMLPVLKQAGVVDSGGQGLLAVLEGAYDCLLGKETVLPELQKKQRPNRAVLAQEEVEIRFGYCTEFILFVKQQQDTMKIEHELKEYLETIGDSIVVVADEEIIKVHVHTNDPGLAIQKALSYGMLSKMKIDNMREEHQETLIKREEEVPMKQKAFGFIAVSLGEGLHQIWEELGIDVIIEGGQTMNPSTQDLLQAAEKICAKTVFIFPNNKNVILAANQAKELIQGKDVRVIPSETIPQGMAAMIGFVQEKTVEENITRMMEEIKKVKTGQITYAVRDTELDGKQIHQGDIMGIADQGILSVGKDREQTTLQFIELLIEEDTQLISIFYGADTTEEEANKLLEKLQQTYPDLDVELYFGGQPIYYYLISVEA